MNTRCCYWCRTRRPVENMTLVERKGGAKWSCGACPKRKIEKAHWPVQGEILGRYRILARRPCW